MDVALLVLTTLSLVTAVGLAAALWAAIRREEARTHARIAALSAAIDIGPPGPDATPRIAVGSAHRVMRLGVAAAMASVVVVGVAIEARRDGDAAAATSGPPPLELVSMRQVLAGSTLTVSGTVRAPATGPRRRTVEAVVTTFDRDARPVATASGPLAIAPHDESSFAVAVPNGSRAARYRVSFRAGGNIVRHVDRRSAVASFNGR